MKCVFIAAPFTAPTPWDVEQNVRIAEVAALEVARLGHMPLCPHANTRFFDKQLTADFWYAGTLELMRRCDAVVLVGAWRKSVGCARERDEALRLELPVFDGVTELAQEGLP